MTSQLQFGNSLNVFESEAITLMDTDIYSCNGNYGNDQFFEESVNVTVRGKFCTYCSL